MKRKNIIIAVLLCSLLFTACKKNQTPAGGGAAAAPESDTTPTVETVYLPLEITYEEEFLTKKSSYTYDENGNLTHLLKSKNGSVIYEGSFTFDENNLLLSSKQISYENEVVSETITTTCTYNEKVLVSKETITDDGAGTNRTTVVQNYGKDGKLGEELLYLNGMLHSSTSYRYDDKGQELSRTVTQGDTVVLYTFEYAYDGKGNVGQVIVRRDGVEQYRDNMTWRDDGRLERSYRLYADGKLEDTLHSYNENGQLYETVQMESSQEQLRIQYTYDQNGNRSKITESVSGQPVRQHTLAYDENNNCTSQVCRSNDEVVWQEFRTYTAFTVSTERAAQLKAQEQTLIG